VALIPILLLLLGSFTLWLLRARTPRILWSVSAAVTLFVWGTLSLSFFALPAASRLSTWQPEQLFASTLELRLDSISWAFIWAAITLTFVVVLAAPVRMDTFAVSSPLFLLIYSAMALAAMMAGNLLTVIMLWALIDMGTLLFALRMQAGRPKLSDLMTHLAFDAIAILLVASTALVTASESPSATFEIDVQSPQAAILLGLAVLLRLGLLPLHFSLAPVGDASKSVAVLIRFLPPAMALTVLARLMAEGVPDPVLPWLRIAGGLGVVVGGLRWTLERENVLARPFFVLTLSGSAVLAASLVDQGGDVILTAAGSTLLLIGAVSALADFYSPAQRIWYFVGGALLTGLPMTPLSSAATAIMNCVSSGQAIIPALIAMIGLIMLAAGTFSRGMGLPQNWPTGEGLARMASTVSLALPVLVLTGIGLHLSTRVTWEPLTISVPILVLAVLAMLGLRRLPNRSIERWGRVVAWLDPAPLYRFLGQIYISAMRWIRGVRSIIEGEGAMLWLLLIVLLMAVFFRR
jgi:hypothetical protein